MFAIYHIALNFMPVGTQRAVRDVAQAEYGSRDLHGVGTPGLARG
jgi:hypothetical protein